MSFQSEIKSKSEYQSALERIEILISKNPVEGSSELAELNHLGELVSNYEDLYFPIQ